MTSKVRVNMFPCEMKTEIEVQVDENGEYVVNATSACPKAMRYIEGLGPLSLIDLTDKKESKIYRDFVNSEMSANCLILPGVMSAAWLEAGMIARSQAKKGIPQSIEFIDG
jgi:hypothetical protein